MVYTTHNEADLSTQKSQFIRREEEMESDRLAQLKQFDDSKLGVKGLVEAGLATIPSIFVHPPENLRGIHPTSSTPIPTIDLQSPDAGARICAAAREFGFFQITNHGIPPTVSSTLIAGLKAFNEKPAIDRAAYYSRDTDSGVNFNSNVDLLKSRAASWRDTLQVMTAPRGPDWTCVPDECREAMMEWDLRVVSLADELMRLLCDGLGVSRDRLKEMSCLEARLMAGHYYPYCPEPDRTLGIKSHSDPGVLTVLLQNQVEGLQVKFRDEWIEVKPLEDALVINIGDLLQIMSNDEYKSVEHRVVANSHYESRISVAIFCNPSKRGDGDFFGPLPELITPDKPASYRNFTVPEFLKQFFGSELGGHVKHFRLIEKDDAL